MERVINKCCWPHVYYSIVSHMADCDMFLVCQLNCEACIILDISNCILKAFFKLSFSVKLCNPCSLSAHFWWGHLFPHRNKRNVFATPPSVRNRQFLIIISAFWIFFWIWGWQIWDWPWSPFYPCFQSQSLNQALINSPHKLSSMQTVPVLS